MVMSVDMTLDEAIEDEYEDEDILSEVGANFEGDLNVYKMYEDLTDYALCVTTKSHANIFVYDDIRFVLLKRVLLSRISTAPTSVLDVCKSRYTFIEFLKIGILMLCNDNSKEVEFYQVYFTKSMEAGLALDCILHVEDKVMGYQLIDCTGSSPPFYELYIFDRSRTITSYRISKK
jgi:hypothetical protein